MLLGIMGHLLLYEQTQNGSHISIRSKMVLVNCIDPENNYNDNRYKCSIIYHWINVDLKLF